MTWDRGTIIRSIALGVTLLNQLLIQFDMNPIPGNNEYWYHILSTIVMAAVAVWTWFKNNYITFRGKQQREVLVKSGLTEVK